LVGLISARQALLAGGLLALASFLSLLLLDRPLVRGDGLAYYMWLEPVAVHFSFDLTWAAEKFGAVNEYQIFKSPTGAYASAFSFGPAVLLAPWYRLALLLPDVQGIDHAHYVKYQADSFSHSLLVLLGANLYTVAAVLLSFKSALTVTRAPWAAAAAAFALLWGTPLIYYSTVEGYMAHAIGAFLLALALWLYLRPRVPWLWLGVTLSVAVLVRWQLALLVIPIGMHLLWQRRWGDLLRLGAGTLSLAWLVPLSWYGMFGQLFVVPAAIQNSRPFLGPPVHALDVLIALQGGLFPWAPLTLLATVGLALLWRRDRRLAGVALSAFALQVLINGGVSDWAAGWSYGMRRLTELYPFFVVGLAIVLAQTGRVRFALWSLAGALLAFSVMVLVAHLVYINYFAGHGGSLPEELGKWYGTLDNPRLTWQVIKEHYGPWAWVRPGP
jgi:hypothetical protein